MRYACLLSSITQIVCTNLERWLGTATPIGEGEPAGIVAMVPADARVLAHFPQPTTNALTRANRSERYSRLGAQRISQR